MLLYQPRQLTIRFSLSHAPCDRQLSQPKQHHVNAGGSVRRARRANVLVSRVPFGGRACPGMFALRPRLPLRWRQSRCTWDGVYSRDIRLRVVVVLPESDSMCGTERTVDLSYQESLREEPKHARLNGVTFVHDLHAVRSNSAYLYARGLQAVCNGVGAEITGHVHMVRNNCLRVVFCFQLGPWLVSFRKAKRSVRGCAMWCSTPC